LGARLTINGSSAVRDRTVDMRSQTLTLVAWTDSPSSLSTMPISVTDYVRSHFAPSSPAGGWSPALDEDRECD